jgi:hypothetical protein
MMIIENAARFPRFNPRQDAFRWTVERGSLEETFGGRLGERKLFERQFKLFNNGPEVIPLPANHENVFGYRLSADLWHVQVRGPQGEAILSEVADLRAPGFAWSIGPGQAAGLLGSAFGNWIDLTGLPDGTYRIGLHFDPDNRYGAFAQSVYTVELVGETLVWTGLVQQFRVPAALPTLPRSEIVLPFPRATI